jgi:hypothetical protein
MLKSRECSSDADCACIRHAGVRRAKKNDVERSFGRFAVGRWQCYIR